jgi:hypothetical protein
MVFVALVFRPANCVLGSDWTQASASGRTALRLVAPAAAAGAKGV